MPVQSDTPEFRLPWVFPALTVLYLLAAWLAVYLIDFHGKDLPIHYIWPDSVRDKSMGFLWAELFGEGSPTELLQWAFLAMAFVFSLWCAAHARAGRERLGWLLFSLGACWMFLEDKLNVRHLTTAFVGEHLLGFEVPSLEFRRSLERSLIEIGIYSVMGMIMLSALYLLWSFATQSGRARWLLIVGYFSYVLAASASATRNLGDWYANLGNWLFWKVAATGSVEPSLNGLAFLDDPVGFWFMDFLFEESIELVGACALASWVVAGLLTYERRRKNGHKDVRRVRAG